MFEFVKIFFKKNMKPSIIFMIIVCFLYICLEPSNNCDLNLKFICNISKLFSHPLIIGVIAFLIWCFGVVQVFRKKYETDINKDDEKNDTLKIEAYMIDDWLEKNNVDVAKRYFIKDLLLDYVNKDREEDKENKNIIYDKSNDNKTNSEIQQQMQTAKLNTYNNSYLTFCLLIDRCKTIEFKEDNKYEANQQPYCFQEIAEAFKLDWKGRRYLYYIAYSLLGTIGRLLEEYNKKKDNEKKIPCVNASVVTKWERDHGNKWFCNGGIKDPNWCCYPPYKSKEGEDDRNFILELCKIVKEANDDKIENWKKTYYRLLEKKHEDENNKCKDNTCDLKSQNVLDEVYKNYKENGTKMSYQELEKQAQENNSKSNRDNDKENKEKDDNNK